MALGVILERLFLGVVVILVSLSLHPSANGETLWPLTAGLETMSLTPFLLPTAAGAIMVASASDQPAAPSSTSSPKKSSSSATFPSLSPSNSSTTTLSSTSLNPDTEDHTLPSQAPPETFYSYSPIGFGCFCIAMAAITMLAMVLGCIAVAVMKLEGQHRDILFFSALSNIGFFAFWLMRADYNLEFFIMVRIEQVQKHVGGDSCFFFVFVFVFVFRDMNLTCLCNFYWAKVLDKRFCCHCV
jgi:hypothetical protein